MNILPANWFYLIVMTSLACCIFFPPIPAAANMGDWWEGHLVAEPTGLKDVDITHETLTIDLRPLALGQPAQIEAVYQVNNRGAERKIELIFISGSRFMPEFQVWHENQAVAARLVIIEKLPSSWQPPKTTPGIHDNEGIGYHTYNDYVSLHGQPMPTFSIVAPPGLQTLKVRYKAEAANHLGHPAAYWQLAYVLAPARDWACFGGLDVTIRLPENWLVACQPTLERDGDVLRGSFSDLPADAIALTVQAPAGLAYCPLFYGSRVLLGIVGLGGAFLCYRCGKSRGRIHRRPWLRALLLGIIWGIAVFAAGRFMIQGPNLAVPAFQANAIDKEADLGVVRMLFLSLLAVPAGFAICMFTAISVSNHITDKKNQVSASGECT